MTPGLLLSPILQHVGIAYQRQYVLMTVWASSAHGMRFHGGHGQPPFSSCQSPSWRWLYHSWQFRSSYAACLGILLFLAQLLFRSNESHGTALSWSLRLISIQSVTLVMKAFQIMCREVRICVETDSLSGARRCFLVQPWPTVPLGYLNSSAHCNYSNTCQSVLISPLLTTPGPYY